MATGKDRPTFSENVQDMMWRVASGVITLAIGWLGATLSGAVEDRPWLTGLSLLVVCVAGYFWLWRIDEYDPRWRRGGRHYFLLVAAVVLVVAAVALILVTPLWRKWPDNAAIIHDPTAPRLLVWGARYLPYASAGLLAIGSLFLLIIGLRVTRVVAVEARLNALKVARIQWWYRLRGRRVRVVLEEAKPNPVERRPPTLDDTLEF